MKKNTLLLASFFISITAYSQVGINTESPKATLDIVAKATDTTVMDGIIAPRLTGAQLRAKAYTTDQTGALVYVTAADTAPAGQTVNVNSTGYYYFNGAQWVHTEGNNVNIYNANGTLTNPRTVTLGGNNLTILGTNQSTAFNQNGGLLQTGLSTSATKHANATFTAADNDGNSVTSRLIFQIYPEQPGQIIADNDATALHLSTNATTKSAPITFATSAGSNASGTEKMRITGEGNIGISTNLPTEKLDNNGTTRLRALPLNGSSNAISTTPSGTASTSQNQTFTATRTVVADANGVLGYVTGLPSTGGGTSPSGSINVGETISQVYSIPRATAIANTFNLATYVTANSLPALPVLDGLQINLQGVDGNYYDPRIYNVSGASQLISYQTFATQVNENKTSLNNTVTAGNYVQVDNNNIVFWSTTSAEVETTNLQVQIDANTYRWYEFKWWCMEINSTKKIFLSVTRKA
ncbi:hypothetical protein [Chryseobacterium sp. S90]|uniref:hypothetical protein n=1 Tax=Chryseobacterium sp. S90 TaxID=3395373 RepID=UPI0039BCB5AA